jgi:hypothetical protein
VLHPQLPPEEQEWPVVSAGAAAVVPQVPVLQLLELLEVLQLPMGFSYRF